MGSLINLLKCCKPLTSFRFSPHANSLRTIQLRAHPSFKPWKRYLVRCLSSLSSPHPLIDEKSFSRTNGGRPNSPPSELWLHNMMSRRKELFKPKVEGKAGMYVCGVTAYDLSHIGHTRVYVTFDVLFRYLKHLGYEVFCVRNFTDVDDKINACANELGEDPISLSRRYCEEFHQDMVHLHCLPPSVEPRVSDHMLQIVDMIKQILDDGYAYRVDGDVYFSVVKFLEYG